MEGSANGGVSRGVAIIVAIVAATLFGGGTYAYVNNNAAKEKKELNNRITELQEQVSDLQTTSTDTSSTTDTSTSATSTTATADETADWKTYTNTKYGFTLTLTDKWEGYKIKEADIANQVDTYCVNVPTTDTKNYPGSDIEYSGYAAPFCIDIYTIAQWNTYNDDNPSLATKLTSNNQYVFAYSTWQDSPADLRASGLDKEVTNVAKSFELTD
jgi:hypothetical protein